MNPVRSPFSLEKGSRLRRLISNGVKIFSRFTPESARILKKGGVGVIPTDTVYGVVGAARKRRAVERIYRLRKRSPRKPMIILIGSLKDLEIFNVKIGGKTRNFLKKAWPGKISVILPCPSKNFFYLHRGKRTLAFRLPAKKELRKFLEITGPLVAPSANLDGRPPAKTIEEAKKYFGGKADFYIDGGRLTSKPSTLIAVINGKISILRQGAVRVRNEKYGSTGSINSPQASSP